MRGYKRFWVPILMVLSLSFLAGSDSECEIEFPDFDVIGYYPYGYDYDYVVVEEVYYDPLFPW